MAQRCAAGPFAGQPHDMVYRGGDCRIAPNATVDGPCFLGAGCVVEEGARVGAETVLGPGCLIGAGAVVERSIVWRDTRLDRHVVVRGAVLGEHCHIEHHAEVGPGTVLGNRTTLAAYSRTPGVPPMLKFDPAVFKAYDVRGLYPSQIDEELVTLIGRGFVAHLNARRIAVSRDMRLSSAALARAFIEGARAQGADVVDIGLMGTDQLYFAVASGGHDGGAQITASHNPGAYNGVKLVGKQAIPLSGDAGISDIRDMLLSDALPAAVGRRGGYSEGAVFEGYLEHVLSFIDQSSLKPFSLVLDAGSGIGGLVAPALFDRLPCQTTRLCFEMDGTFPIHEANPLLEENRRDLVQAVRANSADAGIAWDGDADRCFFVDGEGEFISGDFITALLAEAFLRKTPGATIVYDVRASHAVKDTVAAHGGRR